VQERRLDPSSVPAGLTRHFFFLFLLSFFPLNASSYLAAPLVVCAGYLIALIASGSPYVIAALLAGWVFVAGYSRSSKTWGGLGQVITITVYILVV
jgi:hypothetical protein